MKYIHLFDTVEEFNEIYNGSEYIEPWASYIRETKTITFNKIPQHDYSKDYFTVKALGSGTIVWTRQAIEVPKYRINGGEWVYDDKVSGYNIQVNENDTVEFSYTLSSTSSTYALMHFISPNMDYEIYGNIFSLMYGDDFIDKTEFIQNLTFKQTFSEYSKNENHLISAENLVIPATTVPNSGCCEMFWCCTALTKTPSILPATTLGSGCYGEMFRGCSSITKAPILPATTLAPYCYNWMFGYCPSLTTAPELPATTLAPYCYYMMFQNCVGLTEVPELPATILSQNCYRQMFQDCSNLSYIKCLATGTDTQGMPVTACTDTWIQGVSETGTFVKNAQMQDWPQQYGNHSGIPYGWTVQDAS